MVPTIIRRSALVATGELDRLDPEYFETELIAQEDRLRAADATPLARVAEIVDERVPDPRKAENPDALFQYVEIGGIDSSDGFVLPDAVRCRDAPSRARLHLRKGYVAMSTVRPGRNQVFYVFDDLANAVGTTGLVVLRPIGGYRGPELLLLLKTTPVIHQLARRARASMYPTLHPPDVLDVLLPPLSERAGTQLRQFAEEALAARRDYLKSADQLQSLSREFFDSRGGSGIAAALQRHRPTVRTATSLRVEPGPSLGRLDAEYHSAAYDDVFSGMRRSGATSCLSEIVSGAKRGRSFTTSDLSEEDEGGPAVIKVGSLSRAGIRWDDVGFANRKPAPSDVERVGEGDVLFNAAAHEPSYIAHRVDVVGSVPSGYESRLITTSHVMYLRIGDREEWPPHFIAEFLRHPLGLLQVRRCIRGVRAEVYAGDVVADVVVPWPNKVLRKQVTRLAMDAERHRWRYASAVADGVRMAESDWMSLGNLKEAS